MAFYIHIPNTEHSTMTTVLLILPDEATEQALRQFLAQHPKIEADWDTAPDDELDPELEAALDEAIAQVERGEVYTHEEVFGPLLGERRKVAQDS